MPSLPSALVVGQANVQASLTIVNASGYGGGGGVSVDQITFIPSYRSTACPAADVDPRVLRLGASATNSWTPRG